MRLTFDPVKNARNIAERGLPFELVAEIEQETVALEDDTRPNYGERRVRVLGMTGERLHAVVITYREDAMHAISFRKANRKELKLYGQRSG
jgi:uncharacterized DUF497 family protein